MTRGVEVSLLEYRAGCLWCEQRHEGPGGKEWARAHVLANPDHRVMVDVCYTVQLEPEPESPAPRKLPVLVPHAFGFMLHFPE